MPVREQVAIKTLTVAELSTGDKLLQDMVGYKDRIIFPRKHIFSPRDIKWLQGKLNEKAPRLTSEKYLTGRKAGGRILTKDGKLLVKAGQVITAEALKPLLAEGFQVAEQFEGEGVLYYRKTIWPKDQPYNIADFNPKVKVETTEQVNTKE